MYTSAATKKRTAERRADWEARYAANPTAMMAKLEEFLQKLRPVELDTLTLVGEVAVMDLRQYVGKVAHARGISPDQAAVQMRIVLSARRAAGVTE